MGIQQIERKSNQTHCGHRTNTIGNYVKPIMGIQRIKWKSNQTHCGNRTNKLGIVLNPLWEYNWSTGNQTKPIVGIELTQLGIMWNPLWEYNGSNGNQIKPIVGIELTHREIDETQPSWEYSDQWDFIQIPLMEFVLWHLSHHTLSTWALIDHMQLEFF